MGENMVKGVEDIMVDTERTTMERAMAVATIIIIVIMAKRDTKVSRAIIHNRDTAKGTKVITIELTKRVITRVLVVLPKDTKLEDNIMEVSITAVEDRKQQNTAKRVTTRRVTQPKDSTTLTTKTNTASKTSSMMIITPEDIMRNMEIMVNIMTNMEGRSIMEVITITIIIKPITEIRVTI